ncbi:MAG: methionine ABC transporter permease [Erysipelothrix sp.]
MLNFLIDIAPNLVKYQDEFFLSINETVQMMVIAGFFSFVVGLLLGVILVVTRKGGIMEQPLVYQILDKSTNLFRSIPFVILLTALIPLTRIIAGTPIGVRGAIFPLVVGCTPFFMRQVDMALSDLDPGLIEAAQSMGLSPLQILVKVYLRESIPALTRSTSITLISLLGLTAMGGAVGAGGIGAFVIRYGHGRFMADITYASIIVILLMVSIIQAIANIIIKKTTH